MLSRSLTSGSAASRRCAVISRVTHQTTVTLKTPVGLVFTQKTDKGPVTVDEITPGGSADEAGKGIQVGDVLSSCSATVLKEGRSGQAEGHGDRLYDNWDRVMFDCSGKDFKTVMSALKSNTPRWGIFDVTLVFDPPGGVPAAAPAAASTEPAQLDA